MQEHPTLAQARDGRLQHFRQPPVACLSQCGVLLHPPLAPRAELGPEGLLSPPVASRSHTHDSQEPAISFWMRRNTSSRWIGTWLGPTRPNLTLSPRISITVIWISSPMTMDSPRLRLKTSMTIALLAKKELLCAARTILAASPFS